MSKLLQPSLSVHWYPILDLGLHILILSGQAIKKFRRMQTLLGRDAPEPSCFIQAGSGPQPYTRKVTQPYTRIGTRLYTRKQLSHTRETDSAIHAKSTQPYTRPNICSGHSFDDCMLPVCYYMITRRLSARDLQSMCEQMLCYV